MGSKPPTKRLDLLRDRNAKLSAQAEVQRKEIERLQRGLEGATAREERLNETVLCVSRLWEELNGAIAFLNFRCVPALHALPPRRRPLIAPPPPRPLAEPPASRCPPTGLLPPTAPAPSPWRPPTPFWRAC